jgi:hypothetical protein
VYATCYAAEHDDDAKDSNKADNAGEADGAAEDCGNDGAS